MRNKTFRQSEQRIQILFLQRVTPLFSKVDNASRAEPIPLVAYPNSGEVFDTVERKWIWPADCGDFIEDIPAWVALGAKYVGGCCRNDASRIRKMRQFIDGCPGLAVQE